MSVCVIIIFFTSVTLVNIKMMLWRYGWPLDEIVFLPFPFAHFKMLYR